MSTLHPAEGLDAVGADIIQVGVPLGHEEAVATSTGFRAKLLMHGKGPNDLSTSVLFHCSITPVLFATF